MLIGIRAQITATMRAGTYQPPAGRPCWHTVRDAADALGVSESRIHRAMRSAGVQRVRGGTVAGMVEIAVSGSDRRGYVPYAR